MAQACEEKPQASLGGSCSAWSSVSASATAEEGGGEQGKRGGGPWRAYCCTLNTGGEEGERGREDKSARCCSALPGKVLGVGVGGGRGRRRRRGIMRRRTLESVLLQTQHRGEEGERKEGRVGLLLRLTAHPLYKPKTNSRRFPLLGSWFLAHILRLFITTLHLNSGNLVCCSDRRRSCCLQSQALLHPAIQK